MSEQFISRPRYQNEYRVALWGTFCFRYRDQDSVLHGKQVQPSGGDYQRYIDIDGERCGHILDPKTGWPVRGLPTVSVVAPQCMIADSTSTIAMLTGDDGKRWLDEAGLLYLWFDDLGKLHRKDNAFS